MRTFEFPSDRHTNILLLRFVMSLTFLLHVLLIDLSDTDVISRPDDTGEGNVCGSTVAVATLAVGTIIRFQKSICSFHCNEVVLESRLDVAVPNHNDGKNVGVAFIFVNDCFVPNISNCSCNICSCSLDDKT